ncbi:flagellar protein FlaG [Chitinilyticum aquatile]|uniref:flagellar protein FlaG n=1 Tax=Chitinilyticum aquatile TaxID=362520 RepID=UPI0006869262|nr:flagellar protein FlaG [Chitinilyticum aquatile]
MQINSVGATQQPLPKGDEAVRSQMTTQTSSRLANETAKPVEASRDAVQAIDPKEQARQIDEAVKQINETIKTLNKDVGLEFSTDEDTKIKMVKLVDTQSKEILRQIPSQEVLNIAKAIDKLQGLLVRDKA